MSSGHSRTLQPGRAAASAAGPWKETRRSLVGWHHRWNILAFTLLAQALIVGIQLFSFPFWVVPWLEEFKATRSELMLIASASVLLAGVVSPFAGAALDRFPVRTLVCFGATLFAASLAIISVAQSYWLVALLFGGVQSVGVVLAGPIACQTLVTRWFASNRGLALGISALGLAIGSVVVPPVITALIPLHGWRTVMRLLAAATFLLIVPIAWFVLARQPDAPSGTPAAKAAPQQAQWTTAMLLRNRDFLIICVGFAALLCAYLPVLYNVGAYARDIGVTQQQAASGVAWSAVALTLSKLGFGRLADILEHRGLYWLAVAPMLLGIVLVSIATSFPPLLAGLLLVSFGQGAYLPLLASMIASRFGARSFGQAIGLAAILTQTSAFAPYLSGVIRDGTGNYMAAFLLLSLPLLPAMIAMRWLSSKPTVIA